DEADRAVEIRQVFGDEVRHDLVADELAAAHRILHRIAEHASRRDRAPENLAGRDMRDFPGERDARRLCALAAARRTDEDEIQLLYFFAYDGGAVGERLELHLGDHARERLHPA